MENDFDVVVVGSGAGALVAAITAADHGLKTVVIEKGASWGGSSALSGGGLWIPNNHVSKEAGLEDSEEEALQYMDNVINYKGSASSPERRHAYVKTGPKMVKFLEEKGMSWVAAKHYPDYYPEKPGGKIGRSIEAKIYDGRKLKETADTLRKGDLEAPIPLYSGKVAHLPKALTNVKDFTAVANMFIGGTFRKVKGEKSLSIGAGLCASLMGILKEYGVPVWLSTPLKDLVIEHDKLIGVIAERDGKPQYIKCKSVILATGGFERNAELRKKYHDISADWTSGSEDNTGDLLHVAEKHNLDTDLLHEAWWGPATLDETGARKFLVHERSMPHSMIVDQTGERYFNESENYVDAGRRILERNKANGRAIHSWLILDSRSRKRYLFGSMLPGRTPKEAIEKGFFIKADTLEELAQKTGIDSEQLQKTAERFNEFAKKGYDEDFFRGNSAYDNYYGDPVYQNPNLGEIKNPPYYACKIFPGDLGTKGGIVTNEFGQALREGKPIEGLYATGNCSASVMGDVYPGPGATIGPTTVFGYISANHIKESVS